MVLFIRVLWVPFFTYVLTLFSFIGRHIFRLREKFISETRNINLQLSQAHKDYQIDENIIDDKVEAESLLQFRFPTFDEFVQLNQLHSVSNSESKGDVYAQPSVDIDESQLSLENQSSVTEDGNELCSEIDVSEKLEEIASVKTVEENFEERVVENQGKSSGIVGNSLNNVHIFDHGSQFFTDNHDLVSDSDSDSIVCSSISSFRNSFSDGLLSDIDFERAFEIQTSLLEYRFNDISPISDFSAREDIEYQNLSKDYCNDDDNLEDEDEEILQELNNLESNLEDKNDTQALGEQSVEKKIVDEESLDTNIDFDDVNEKIVGESVQISEKWSSEEQVCSDSEKQKQLEREWEHQDLVEQLKMEIKKARAIGLATIFEESDTPIMFEELKPWKIQDKYEHEGAMDELHKFYKSYRERMRKLDILNYQKMYATGFLKLKEPVNKSFNKYKISNQAIAAIVSVDCWPCKPKSSRDVTELEKMKKYSREIESELEMVYVGQMCLSWEFLAWEYLKALELFESDPHGLRHYNNVAEKFQIFQVLLTRFLEDESSFQGSRLQHYVQNRCALRNLLQVPLVRDDNYRNRKKERKVVNEKDAISSLQLVEMIEESIRIIWKFIRADRDTSCSVLVNCQPKDNVELQNPADTSLLSRLRSTLHKKEKKLKEARIEHCLMRNLHGEEEGADHVFYFFSQVDLKLVSRVLNMSSISRDQLVWCSDKLNKIKFIGRKLHVKPSVLLFPC